MISHSDSANGTTTASGDALVNRVQQLRLNNQIGAAKKGVRCMVEIVEERPSE